MKKFLLILIFLIYSIGVAYGFEIQAENTTQPEINKTNLKEIKNIMDIRPKAEITSDVSIPIAEPVSKVETQEEKSLGENINETIPNDNKDKEQQNIPEELVEEITNDVQTSEMFTENDFSGQEEEIILEVNSNSLKKINPESSINKLKNIHTIDKRTIQVMPYGNPSGSIYRF